MYPTITKPRIDTGLFSFGRQENKKAKIDFRSWLCRVSSTWVWDWNYQLYIQDALQKVTDGKLDRLMLFVPPRHGKSEMVTIRYPVYRLEIDQSLRIIQGAYNQTLANKFSRKSRRIARDRLDLSKERTAVEDWETELGGGIRAVGVGGGITGQGGQLIIIDDPVKNRKEANSKVYRDAVYDWYTDDLYTRLEPGGAIILIMTRWHEDDLAGRILNSDDGKNWTVINFPAIAESKDVLGRNKGDALCPARYPVSELDKIKVAIGRRSFSALYQQTPQEQEGDTFKRSWFEIVKAVPADAVRVRYWDYAATQDDGDYTAGVLMARKNNVYYIEDVKRGQWSSGKRDEIILQTCKEDNQKYKNIVTWREQEPGSSGVDTVKAFVTMLNGYSAKGDKVSGNKELRADPLASQAEVGNVKILKASWNEDYLDELTSFPNGAHDDMVDGSSGGYNKLTGNNETKIIDDPFGGW